MEPGRRGVGAERGHTLALLKPHAVAEGLEPHVRAAFAVAGLDVVCDHFLTLTNEDRVIRGSVPAACVIEHALLRLQFRRRRVWYAVLRGPDAIRRGHGVKRQLRRRYARGAFANVVHTPDTPSEVAHELRVLGSSCPCCVDVVEYLEASYPIEPLRALPAPFAYTPQTAADVIAIVEKMWNDPESILWRPDLVRPAVIGDPGAADCSIWLHDDDTWSIDAVVVGLASGAELDLATAVRLGIVGAHCDDIELVQTRMSRAQEIARILALDYGLPVTMRAIAST